ncbi:MAG: 3-deoxy-7-phosphoheptulonate synthase [Pseudonocardia sp.]|nr:3-deoxy-7-phosphoheptulonate synthase [Pseudonocardia sp.]
MPIPVVETDEVRSAVGEPWESAPAAQQPQWRAHSDYHRTCAQLRDSDPLVTPTELDTFRTWMAVVAGGQGQLLQLGDCAEGFHECTPAHTFAKIDMLRSLAVDLAARTGGPVVPVGRLGGQFAKPRSRPTECYGGVELPSFRGHMINSEIPTPSARQHDPRRMLWAYEASAKVTRWLGIHRDRGTRPSSVPSGPWSSHEALVVDYEASLIRRREDTGAAYLGSTHLPWLGERTRDPDGANALLLAAVSNPVACKVGPAADPVALVRLCGLLDPDREPGRLTLIPRMGRDPVSALTNVVVAVRRAGHPVVWLCDPMHGNTVTTRNGTKTRYLDDILAEVAGFRAVLERYDQHPGGLHLEVASSEVTECIGGRSVPNEDALAYCYTSLCDPRLNPEQARQVLKAWAQ